MNRLTDKQAWLFIAQKFERYHELDERCSIISSGLCHAVGLVNTNSETCMRMFDQLRAYNNYSIPTSQFWFPCGREHAGIRALTAYFLAEVGEELIGEAEEK